jgi:hypothetical protein
MMLRTSPTASQPRDPRRDDPVTISTNSLANFAAAPPAHDCLELPPYGPPGLAFVARSPVVRRRL